MKTLKKSGNRVKPRRSVPLPNARRNRMAVIERNTTESQIRIALTLDGTGNRRINTTIPFLDHMLDLLAKHGFFDLRINAVGDTHIDDHHTVEDVGIVLGEALKQALGKKEGVRRFGTAWVPLDETLAQVTVDLSGRPYLVYNVKLPHRRIKGFDLYLFEDFFQALSTHAGMNLHINVPYGRNPHHIMESIFKAMAKALDQAVSLDPRVSGVLSTKGSL
jgi:imidazoleglycerol-phosphate dehydratase